MELYGSYTSPYVRHCRLAMLEAGLDFKFVETDALASARKSPTQKVPFLKDGDITLNDSCSIVKYVRERSGKRFFEDTQDYDQFCMVNTLLDAAANLFMLEKDGITPTNSTYLKRQQRRIETGLRNLDNRTYATVAPYSDSELRLACFLDWGLFRERISLDNYPNLDKFLEGTSSYELFKTTMPHT